MADAEGSKGIRGMSHLRLWRFEVDADKREDFIRAYGPDGDWARLFRTHPGYLRTELWAAADGSFITTDHWRSEADFDRFQLDSGDRYAALDAELEGLCRRETFLATAESVD